MGTNHESSISALAVALFVGAFLVHCSPTPGAKWCIDSDLGRFSLSSLHGLSGGKPGCQAWYSDPCGSMARIRVDSYNAGMFENAGVPMEFEKQMVFVRKADSSDKLLIRWYSDQMAVHLTLTGLDKPGGPVLRGYLHRYPSLVVDRVHAVEKEVEFLKQTSRKVPANAAIHLKLAQNYRKLGNTIMAANEYQISVEKDPHCYQCYFEMGTLYKQLRHWDLSIRALRRATSIRPEQAQGWMVLGDVSFYVRNRLEAIRGYEKALDAGLTGKQHQRAKSRLDELRKGKFLIQLLPGVSHRAKQTPSSH